MSDTHWETPPHNKDRSNVYSDRKDVDYSLNHNDNTRPATQSIYEIADSSYSDGVGRSNNSHESQDQRRPESGFGLDDNDTLDSSANTKHRSFGDQSGAFGSKNSPSGNTPVSASHSGSPFSPEKVNRFGHGEGTTLLKLEEDPDRGCNVGRSYGKSTFGSKTSTLEEP